MTEIKPFFLPSQGLQGTSDGNSHPHEGLPIFYIFLEGHDEKAAEPNETVTFVLMRSPT